MVEIARAEDLEAWLKDRPREVAVAIAVRAALRVLPMVVYQLRSADSNEPAALVLPMFRALAISRTVGLGLLTRQALGSRAYALTRSVRVPTIFEAAAAHSAAMNAAEAVAMASTSASSAAVRAAAREASMPPRQGRASKWSAVKQDVSLLSGGEAPDELMQRPLWQAGATMTLAGVLVRTPVSERLTESASRQRRIGKRGSN